jgi:putative PIN family toxin of toxin-antitoxin system
VNWCLQNGEIVISEHILDELMTEIRANTNAPYRWRRAILDGLQKATILAEFDELPNIVRDPKDNHVIAAALSANAQIIVTGDQDLLSLKQVENIQILKSADFMEQTV